MDLQYQQFFHWLECSFAQDIMQCEKSILHSFWKEVRGNQLLMLGSRIQEVLIDSCVIQNKMIISPYEIFSEHKPDVYAHYAALPIAPESVDVCVLPHILELADDPYQILREVETILSPEGFIVIVGFNPISLWGLRQFFSLSKQPPWSGTFYSASRIEDWLKVLNFNFYKLRRTCYRLPIAQHKIFKRLKFLEVLGRICFPFLGGIYILVAKKKVVGMTPVKSEWNKISEVVRTGVA